MFRTNIVEKIKTHILCSVIIFRISVVYEKMWENIVARTGPRMTVWRMCIACWISKATNMHARTHTHTHRLCNTHCFIHFNNGSTNAPHCYVTRTLRVWLVKYFNKKTDT